MALFDSKADTYDDFCETPLGHFVNEVERNMIASSAVPKPNERAIDLGCGTGTYTTWLQTLGLQACGVDVSQGMLDTARRKSNNPDVFIQADLRKLPFQNETFDLAIANVVLEFVSEPETVVKEARRILRPEGRLVIGFIRKNSLWGQKYLRRGEEDPSSVYHHARFFSVREAASLGWKPPGMASFGLYVGPDEFVDEQSAWELETLRTVEVSRETAGFFVLRWEN